VDNKNTSADEMRRRAEAIVSEKLAALSDTPTLSSEELRNLVHELQVHQVELEMQNEALCEAQLALQVAHDKYIDLYDYAPVGYVTVDNKGIIHEANLTATHLLGVDRVSLIRKPISRFVFKKDSDTLYLKLQQVFATQEKLICELRFVKENGDQFYTQLEGMAVEDKEGRSTFARLIISDITERKRIEEEKERLIIELQHALAQVKKLSGFIPICASCKKIRDDKGYWRQVEEYIRDHSEAEFSHGICPDCMRSLYPEIADDVLGRANKNEK
jgi:PAS domain S-box-containing protein